MNHTMHIGDKWNILMLDLTYHYLFEALKGVNPINIKTHHLYNDVFLF